MDIKDFDDAAFRKHAKDGVSKFARYRQEVKGKWEAFAERLSYIQGDFSKAETYRGLGEHLKERDKAWDVTADSHFLPRHRADFCRDDC